VDFGRTSKLSGFNRGFKMAHGFSAIPLTDVSDGHNRKNPGTFIEAG